MVSSPRIPNGIHQHHQLAPLTTLEVGGPARFYAELSQLECLREICLWAHCLELPILVLGEGSNLLVSDSGFPGLAIRWLRQGLTVLEEAEDGLLVRVEGGTVWDSFVAQAVANDWSGVECLSGIPGCVGASPIQNIGAYGQEVCETIHSVEVMHRHSGELATFSNQECRFSYRHSAFKEEWRDLYVVTAVNFRLTPGGRPALRYGELSQVLSGSDYDLPRIRAAVLDLRRSKSMVRDLSDPNHRSAGSFFMNPIVALDLADEIAAKVGKMPRYPASEGQVKLSAAWLIENSGFPKGYLKGRAGLSTRHVLALTNRGGASSQELVELAVEIRQGVYRRFKVALQPEAQLVGFPTSPWPALG